MQTYDAIVLGAGMMGSAAAYYLAKAGQRVLLLEQFEIDHKKGSSYGHSRIIRYVYDHPLYIELARATYPMWAEIEAESGETLYVKTGGIDFGNSTSQTLNTSMNTVKTAGVPHEVLSPHEAGKRFPQFRFDEDMTVLYQADTGMLLASKCVLTHIRLAEKYGAVVKDHTPVMSIDIGADSVEITTADETYSAGKLVVTAGSWAKHVLAPTGLDLPLHILRCQPTFFEPVTDHPALYDRSQMPVYILHREDNFYGAMYGLPAHDNVGVKAAFHDGDKLHHPSEVNYTPDDAKVEEIRAGIGDYIPAIKAGRMTETRICLYTMTPDSHFVVDKHPQYPHVAIAAGFSGHGFKFGTIIGSILSDLVLQGSTSHDISLFKADRFA